MDIILTQIQEVYIIPDREPIEIEYQNLCKFTAFEQSEIWGCLSREFIINEKARVLSGLSYWVFTEITNEEFVIPYGCLDSLCEYRNSMEVLRGRVERLGLLDQLPYVHSEYCCPISDNISYQMFKHYHFLRIAARIPRNTFRYMSKPITEYINDILGGFSAYQLRDFHFLCMLSY